jgi:alcohol dehydrogenase class IV
MYHSFRHIIRYNSFNDSVGGNMECAKHYSEIASLVFQGDQMGGADHNSADVYATSEKFATLFESLSSDLSVPKLLREVGIEHEQHLELLATEAMKQTRLLPNNPRVVAYEDALDLYKKAF